MIPVWMKMKFPREEKKPFTLHIPLFIAWILLFIIFVLLLPIWLIIGVVAFLTGYGRGGFLMVPLLINTLWNLKGLEVEVESPAKSFCIKFI